MESALASRDYTSEQIEPLLATPGRQRVPPQSVPAFGATEQFDALHAQVPDFAYKEATLNPTNPRDRASDWEVDIVNRFRQYPERDGDGRRARDAERALRSTWAKPITINDPACLACHSTRRRRAEGHDHAATARQRLRVEARRDDRRPARQRAHDAPHQPRRTRPSTASSARSRRSSRAVFVVLNVMLMLIVVAPLPSSPRSPTR